MRLRRKPVPRPETWQRHWNHLLQQQPPRSELTLGRKQAGISQLNMAEPAQKLSTNGRYHISRAAWAFVAGSCEIEPSLGRTFGGSLAQRKGRCVISLSQSFSFRGGKCLAAAIAVATVTEATTTVTGAAPAPLVVVLAQCSGLRSGERSGLPQIARSCITR